jgi:hypothetical protein
MIEAPGISVRRLAKFFQRVSATAFASLVAVVIVTAPLAPARAAPPPSGPAGGQVRLLQPSANDPRARRCLTRVREELEAGGFTVSTSEFGVGGEGLWMVDPPSPRDGSIATITLIGNPDQGAAELWIVNGVPWGRAVVRRLLVPAGAGTHEDEVLAIRALEFLRASALELAGTRPARPVAPPSVTTTATATATATAPTTPAAAPPGLTAAAGAGPADVAAVAQPRPARPVIALELGASLLESAWAAGPAFLPVARLRAEWLALLETRLSLAGFGTTARVTNLKGSAAVGHVLGLFELRAAFRSGRILRPSIGAGAGVLRVTVDGAASFPYEGIGGQRWAALFDVGAGVTARLGARLSLAFEVHGQLATPYPTVNFSGEEAARIGRPALFSSVTLVTPL